MKYIDVPGFLSREQCRQVIDFCRPRMKPGMSPDPNNNFQPVKSTAQCNNWITFIRPEDHPAVEQITRLIETYTGRPRIFYEPVQVLRYDVGQYYRLHVDNSYPQDPNPRKATFQIYLNDVEEGGETYFPKLGLKFRPQAGRAVYWYNFGPERDGEEHPSAEPDTVHEGMTVKKGQKFALTQWIKLWPVGSVSKPAGLAAAGQTAGQRQ